MIKLNFLDITVNEYYDEEMNESASISYEARQANSNYIKDYTNEQCFEFFKISNSIKLTKKRLEEHSNAELDLFLLKNKELFDVNSSFFKRVYKRISSSLLNFKRNNSK